MSKGITYIGITDENNNIKIVQLPKKFETYFQMLKSNEYKNFLNMKHEKEENFLDKVLSQGISSNNMSLFVGASGTSKSITCYIPEFVEYYNKKLRIDKIKKILAENCEITE